MGFENEIAGSSPERMLLFILPVKKNQVNSYLFFLFSFLFLFFFFFFFSWLVTKCSCSSREFYLTHLSKLDHMLDCRPVDSTKR